MLEVLGSETVETPDCAVKTEPCPALAHAGDVGSRTLEPSEILFASGESRGPLYRIERGAVCHHMHRDDGHHEIIEFAFPGDIIGFGHLATHISTAQALVETEVSLVSARDFEAALEADAQLAARASVAADREFEFVRARALRSSEAKPAARVASFLAALSHMTVAEGRDPTLIADEMSSGAAAEQLRMSPDCLERALSELERHGLIRSSAEGLRIVDRDALETFADAA